MSDVINRPPPTGEGLTFEKVWAMFQEGERKAQESREEFDRKAQESREEFDRRMEKTERLVKRISKQMGGLNNTFGELAEHLVAPGIVKRFNELGYTFDAVATRGCKIYDEKGNVKAEIDMLLENGEYIVGVEVKSKPVTKHIEHHVKRLEILRERRSRLRDGRKIRGAIAGAVFHPGVKEEVLAAGFYVIEQSGDTMRIDVPEGFVPREW